VVRIDRARLERARFSCIYEGQTRFDDLDVQGHVNNAAAVVLLQEARVHLNGAVDLGRRLDGLRVLVAALGVEYAAEMRHPGTVVIGTGVLAIGRSSVTFGQLARQNGRPTLYAEAVIVVADANGPTAIPDVLRQAYGEHLIED
jgi:acyl-CoA thioester hydrolase